MILAIFTQYSAGDDDDLEIKFFLSIQLLPTSRRRVFTTHNWSVLWR